MRKIVLKFGFGAGALLSAMFVTTFQFHDEIGFESGALVLGYTTMVLAFLLIYFGVRSYRDNVAGGTVRFGRAFKVGALIALIASSCYVATWEVIYYGFAPDFMEKYSAHVLEKARADGETEEAIATRKAEMEKFAELYKNPAVNVAVSFLEPLPVALIITLVTAGVVSRRKSGVAAG